MRGALVTSGALAALGLTLLGCDARSTPAPVHAVAVVSGSVSSAGKDAGPAGTWVDLDALPEGALFRLGTRAMNGDGSAVAISDDGVIATHVPELGLVEIARDGKVRRVPVDGCAPSALHYAGTTLLGACDGEIVFRAGPSGADAWPVACERLSSPRFSPHDETLAMLCTRQDEVVVTLVDMTSKEVRRIGRVPREVEEIVVNDAGVVFATNREAALAAIANGKAIWQFPGEHRHIGYDATSDTVVSWSRDTSTFSIVDAKSGKLVRRTPPTKLAVRSAIQVAPDGVSWIMASDGDVRGLVEVDTMGTLVASWPVRGDLTTSAISPDGKLAAGLAGRVLRVDLETKAPAPAAVTDPHAAPATLTSSRSGGRMVLSRADGVVQLFDMRSGKELLRYEGLHDTWWPPVALAPDERRVVVAAEDRVLHVVDADTRSVVCKAAGVRASALYWRKGGVVAIDSGWGREGSMTFVDERCRTIQSSRYDHGLMVVRDEGDTLLVGIGDARSEPQWPLAQLVRVDLEHRTIAAAPPAVVEEIRAWERAVTSGAAPPTTTTRTSRDGSTLLTITEGPPARPGHPARWRVTCGDAKTKEIVSEVMLSKDALDKTELAVDGSWLAVPEGPSVLVYPCRRAMPRP